MWMTIRILESGMTSDPSQPCSASPTARCAFGSLGLPARRRFFPNYDPSATAAVPKLFLPIQTMKMNTPTCERRSTESRGTYSARLQQHHVTFFCDAPRAEAVSLVGDFNGWDP